MRITSIMRTKQKVSFLLFIIFFLSSSTALAVAPPNQPSQGPGGADYTCSKVIKTMHGSDELAYYLFEPDAPKPDTAPVIVFLHGWGGVNPGYYAAWIEHLVRKGNIVIYPLFQSWSSLASSNRYTSNCIQAIGDAIDLLQGQDEHTSQHTKPDLDKFAIAGHSVGGVLALNVAALAQQYGLPVPKSIMSVEPRKVPMLSLVDFSTISPRTLLLVIAADRDTLSADDAIGLFRSTIRIPFQNKDFITLVSDEYGQPSLIADHLAPVCNAAGTGIFMKGDTNALDYYGTWKLLDALTNAAFYGKNREYALGNTPQQRYMGKWSDGKPVKELIITDYPLQRSRELLRLLTPRSKFQEQQSTESEHQGGS